MRFNVLILLFAVALTALFSGCKTCYQCLADGENFDMPVTSDQAVTYVNDSDIQKSFSVKKTGGWPADEYCGRIGSGSYGACGAHASVWLENSQDSLTIGISCSTGYNDDVELHVTREVGIGKWLMSINSGIGSATAANGTVLKVNNITIGGHQYSDVYEYKNNSAGIHECTYFAYSVSYGVLKFTMRLDNSVENWVLVR
jgi:hypothetical protein